MCFFTGENNRTTRLSILEGCGLLGKSLAFFMSGVLLHRHHYTTVFLTAASLNAVGVLYICMFLKEPPRDEEHRYILHKGRRVTATELSSCMSSYDPLTTISNEKHIRQYFIETPKHSLRSF